MDYLELIEKKIEAIPPLPDTVVKIQEICSNPKSSVRDLADVIENDPILSAKILKVANSPYYGFTSRITSLHHAISLLGINTILGFALDIHVKENTKDIDLSPYNLTVNDFSNSSHLQCKLMMKWHFSLNLKESDLLITSSFLNELGKILLAQIVKERNLKYKFLLRVKDAEIADDIFDVEKEFFGINSVEITGKIFYRWRLNVMMVYSILASINPNKSDEKLSPYGYAIKIVRTAVGQKGQVTKNTLDRALKLIDEANFNKKYFLLALNSII